MGAASRALVRNSPNASERERCDPYAAELWECFGKTPGQEWRRIVL